MLVVYSTQKTVKKEQRNKLKEADETLGDVFETKSTRKLRTTRKKGEERLACLVPET